MAGDHRRRDSVLPIKTVAPPIDLCLLSRRGDADMYGTGLLRGKECPVARAPPELMPIMAPWPPYYFGHVRPVFKEENLLAGGVASSLVGTVRTASLYLRS